MFNFGNVRTRTILGFIGFSALGFMSFAQAANVELNLRMKALEEYSSNVYLTEEDEKDDYTSRLSPGLDLKWSTSKSYLNINYTFNAIVYSFLQDKERLGKEKEYAIWHNLKFKTGTHFGTRLYFDIIEEFFQNDDPYQIERGFLVGRNEYSINRLSPKIRYKFGDKFQLEFKHLQEILNYKQGDSGDSREHREILSMRYKLNSKNWLRGECHYAERHFDISQDYRIHQGWLKFHHILNSYLKCDLGGGYQRRDYTEGPVENWEGITALAGFEATTWNKLSGRLTYQFQPNTIGDFVFYRINRLDLHLEYELLTDLLFVSDSFIQWDNYRQPGERHDRLAGWGGDLRYTFQEGWQLEVGYHRLERHSNISGNSYHENNVFLSLSAYYDLF